MTATTDRALGLIARAATLLQTVKPAHAIARLIGEKDGESRRCCVAAVEVVSGLAESLVLRMRPAFLLRSVGQHGLAMPECCALSLRRDESPCCPAGKLTVRRWAMRALAAGLKP